LEKITPTRQANSPPTADYRFEFHKCGQFIIDTHNETLSIAAMRVSNPDCSPAGIHG
jgi:hypothetical protein